AFIEDGATVVAVARDPSPLADLAARSTQLQFEAADASDPIVAGTLLERHAPDVLALVAGATPLLRPVHHHTWGTFSANWPHDVRMPLQCLREALPPPGRRGSRVIVLSGGAALQGAPLSGGSAGAKQTQRFMAEYAAQESRRSGLGITVTAVLPRLTPATDLGRPAVAAYAARSGLSEADYLAQLGEPVTPRVAGAAFLRLAAGSPDGDAAPYLLTGEGLQPLK